MKTLAFFFITFLSVNLIFGQSTKKLKSQLINYIDSEEKTLIGISNKIWNAAEIAFQEKISAQTLITYAIENGFNVEEKVASIPTAFVASYGSGKPIIGILGEFDALPGI